MLAPESARLQQARLDCIGDSSGYEKDGYIDDIGGFADSSVVGIIQHGYEDKPRKCAHKLNAPEAPLAIKNQALHKGENRHRPEKQLHMLPGGLVHAREGGYPPRLAQPLVKEMEQCADYRRHREAR